MSQIPIRSSSLPPSLTDVVGVREERGFFARIPGSFVYPFRFGGTFRWFMGGLFLWLGIEATRFGARSLFLCGPILGYFATYLLLIVNASGDGSDEIPGWPGFEPGLVSNFVMFNLTMLLCLLPILLYIAGMIFWHFPLRYLILAICLSYFVLPMGMMRVSMLQTLESLNPFQLFGSIFRVLTPYMGLCLILTGLTFLQGLLKAALSLIPYAGNFFIAMSSFYFMILFMRVLGVFYYVYRHQLDWFAGLVPDLPPPHP